MKLLSLSIFTLALAIAFAGYSFANHPVVPPVAVATTITKPAELLDWEDEQVEEYLYEQEGTHYPLESWLEAAEETFELNGI